MRLEGRSRVCYYNLANSPEEEDRDFRSAGAKNRQLAAVRVITRCILSEYGLFHELA